jgi:hypothetical protein
VFDGNQLCLVGAVNMGLHAQLMLTMCRGVCTPKPRLGITLHKCVI